MRFSSRLSIKAVLAFLLVVGATVGVLLPASAPAADPAVVTKQRPIRISLFPYVPDPKLIQEAITNRWKQLHPDVSLEFVDGSKFDSYKQDPPDDLDVFEFDAIGLEYYVRNNFVSPLTQGEVNDAEDILDFAWKGSMVDGRIYAITRLACTYVLIYRKDDKELAEAVGLPGLHKVLGDGPKKLAEGQKEPVPEDGKGLLIACRVGPTAPACISTPSLMSQENTLSDRNCPRPLNSTPVG